MKTVQTLDTRPTAGLVQVQEDNSDCIQICDSASFDLVAMSKALQAQAKHGCLGEALQWLFLDESGEDTALVMKEDRDNPDWVKSYSAVYWFTAGWSDRDYASTK